MPLQYLLDTNICIYIAKKEPISVLRKFEQLVIGEVGMSVITYGELRFGAQKSKYKKKTIQILEALTSFISPLPLPTSTGQYYGEIRATLEKKGTLIGNNDLWIAAHALALNVALVTNNTKEFIKIPNLNTENWVIDEN